MFNSLLWPSDNMTKENIFLYKVWVEITYAFRPTLYCADYYLSTPGLKLIHVSKRGHWCGTYTYIPHR